MIKMNSEIKCGECRSLLSNSQNIPKAEAYDVIWIGISAKMNKDGLIEKPLASETVSGRILDYIEEDLNNIKFYRTNLVKCPPVDSNNKLRYPTNLEIESCMKNLMWEIENLSPKVVILLGNNVRCAIEKFFKLKIPKCENFNCIPVKYNSFFFLATYHPAYMSVYKKKEIQRYRKSISDIIQKQCLMVR